MIELNWTFFVQIFNFLLLIFILNKILYKPILKVLDEREARIAGGQEKAKELLDESQSILKSYNEKLYGAKIDAMTVKNSSRKQAVDEANEIIENARRNAETIVLDVQKEMTEEIARVKSELEPEIGVMAGTIAQQILGRKIA